MYHVALSPDGTKIAFNSNSDGDIYVVNTDGSGLVNLTWPMDGSEPAWSPDGQRIAFQGYNGSSEIWVMNADGTGKTNLTNTPNPYINEREPAWSPDGTKIVYSSDQEGSSFDFDIWVMNPDGSAQTQLTLTDEDEATPTWSSTNEIAFVSEESGYSDIKAMNADGSGVRYLTNGGYGDNNPTWSPDGSKLAFESFRNTNSEGKYNVDIYMMNADGSGVTNLTDDPSNDTSPTWSQRSSEPSYSISGHVQNQAGAAMVGVNVCAQNGLCATTNSAGDYSFSNLPAGSYTLTATKSEYTFTPPSRAVTVPPNATGVNFTGAASTYSISGRVQNQAGAAIAGVQVCTQNANCVTTNASGNYSIGNLAAGSYTLTATKSGYTFAPPSQTVTVPPSKTGVDFAGSQTSVIDLGFRPYPDGFQFSNFDFAVSLFGGKYGAITLEDWRYLFGDDVVCRKVLWFECLEDMFSWNQRRMANIKLWYSNGRCEGMAATSLMLYLGIGPNDRNEPSDFNGAQETYYISLPDINSYVDANMIRQAYSSPNQLTEQYKPSEVLAAIRKGIGSGDDPVLVTIQEGPGKSGHTIVPYLIENKGGGLYWVRVYDPNRPWPDEQWGDYPLVINTVRETWEFLLWESQTWKGDARSHTLSYTPISLYTQKLSCPWCISSQQNRPQVLESKTIMLAGPGHLLIENDAGRIGFVDGEYVNEMPGASASPIFGGLGDDSDPVYHVPIDASDESSPYTISIIPEVQRMATDAPISVTLFGPGRGISVENIVATDDLSTWLWAPQNAHGVFVAANDPQEVTIKLVANTDQHSTLYQLGGVDMGAPNIVWAGYSSERSQLTVSTQEASGGLYDLSIESVSAAGTDHFRHNQVRIGSGDIHIIDVSSWQEDGYVTVSIDNDSDGIADEEQKLQDLASSIVQLPVILNSSSNQPPPTNLALGRPAFATSDQPPYFVTHYGNDGDQGTRWSSTSGQRGEWWMVDLGSTRAFNQVKINWEAAYATSYAVRWSNGGLS